MNWTEKTLTILESVEIFWCIESLTPDTKWHNFQYEFPFCHGVQINRANSFFNYIPELWIGQNLNSNIVMIHFSRLNTALDTKEGTEIALT